MKDTLVVEYSDRILRELNARPKDLKVVYGTGKYRGNILDETDFLLEIGVPEEYIKLVTHRLEELEFIKKYYAGSGRSYDEESDTYQDYEISKISITDAGRYFITNTSFAKERKNRRIKEAAEHYNAKFWWLPLVVSVLSLIVSAVSLYDAHTAKDKATQLELKLKILETDKTAVLEQDSPSKKDTLKSK